MNGERPPVRVVFLGNDAWSVPSLRALVASRFRPALVLTRTPRPSRRGTRTRPTPVAEAASRSGLALLETGTACSGEGLARVRAEAPDLLVVVAYGEILTRELLAVPAKASVNVHFSLLPELRGAAPVQHALLERLERTGVTTMLMDPGLDTGPLLMQRAEAVREEEDAGSLGTRLANIGGDVLVRTLEALLDGSIDPVPQDGSKATWAPAMHAADRALDLRDAASDLAARVRAFAPVPGAGVQFRGSRLKVLRARPSNLSGAEAEPGTLVSLDPLAVATGAGCLELVEVVPAGRVRMSGADFARGAAVSLGERLALGA